MNRGKIIILLILTAAVAVSVYGIWYRHRQMQRVLNAFSAPVAQLIAFGPEAEVLELGPEAAPVVAETQTVTIDQKRRSVVANKSVGPSKGFSNLRADL